MKCALGFTLASLVLLPGVAYAGEFPGLVETLLAVVAGVSLLLGFATEVILCNLRRQPFRWLRGLGYSALWLLGMFVLMWTRRV